MKNAIQSKGAPAAIGTYSQAVKVGAEGGAFTVYLSGQIGLDPETMQMAEGIEAQTRRVVENLRVVLGGIGLTLADVTMARIYLTHFERDYAALNALWPSFFEPGKLPARTTVGVTALAVGALVEIDLVVRRA